MNVVYLACARCYLLVETSFLAGDQRRASGKRSSTGWARQKDLEKITS